jgi:hypothetical protein
MSRLKLYLVWTFVVRDEVLLIETGKLSKSNVGLKR